MRSHPPTTRQSEGRDASLSCARFSMAQKPGNLRWPPRPSPDHAVFVQERGLILLSHRRIRRSPLRPKERKRVERRGESEGVDLSRFPSRLSRQIGSWLSPPLYLVPSWLYWCVPPTIQFAASHCLLRSTPLGTTFSYRFGPPGAGSSRLLSLAPCLAGQCSLQPRPRPSSTSPPEGPHPGSFQGPERGPSFARRPRLFFCVAPGPGKESGLSHHSAVAVVFPFNPHFHQRTLRSITSCLPFVTAGVFDPPIA